MRIKKILILVIALTLVLAAFFLYRLKNVNEKLNPKVGNVVESIYGLGTVTADKIYHFRAGTNLDVRRVFVKEGDIVKPNDPLVQLDDNIMRSKIHGTVTAVGYKEGELAPPQAAIVTVTNLEHLYLEVSLEQQSVLRVKKDQKVFVSFESLRNEKYDGLVKSVYPRENQFIVKIELENWPKGVLPGMTADVAIIVGEKKDVLLIPLRSIVAGKVTRLRGNKKERVPIKLGVIDGEWGEVTSENILVDDQLVTRK